MADQELRDRLGHLLGKIRERGDGTMELRDRLGHLLGTYNPRMNVTRDRLGKLVGKGNLLTTLLRE